MFLNGILILNWLNNPLASWFSMNFNFFSPQIAQFDKRINLFCFVFLILEFLVCLQYLFYKRHKRFHCFYIVYSTAFLRFFNFVLYESIKALEVKIAIEFNLVFANNTILSLFFSVFFLIIHLYFLILAVIA